MKLLFTLISVILICCCISPESKPNVEKRVSDMLDKMTIEEKIGQMTQVTIEAVSKTRGFTNSKHELNIAKLEDAILKYHVGSILNVWDMANSLHYWNEIIPNIQDTGC